MTRDEAIILLSDFLAGNLSTTEHEAITRMMETDSELQRAFEEEKLLDRLLRTQKWTSTRPDFTARVLARAGLPVPQGEMLFDRVLERLSAYAPVGTLALVVLLYGGAIATRLWGMWQGVFKWAAGEFGMQALETDSALPVVSLVMLAAITLITFEFGRRSQSSA
ncbi:MAG: hypothetical protein V1784_05030 [bacterium]